MKSPISGSPGRRIAWLRALCLLGFLALAGRAGHLVLEDRARNRGAQQKTTVIKVLPARGTVYDRELRELAITVNAPSVYAIPSEMSDPAEVGHTVAGHLDLDPDSVAKRLANRERFAFVKRWVTPQQAQTIADLKLPGIGIIEEPRRAYPAGALAGRVVGFTDIDGRGARGVEQQENQFLRGQNYSVVMVRDARGQTMSKPVRLDEARGGDIALTIDTSLQAHAEAALAQAVENTGAIGGTILSLIPATGAIQVLAEAPNLDPNGFRRLSYDTTGSPAFHAAVEPGSTMKAFLVAAALDAGTLEPDDVIDCSGGEYRVPGKTIRDHHDYGILDPARVLWHSSNVGAVQIAEKLGREAHYHALSRFGFGKRTGSGFPNESSGLMRPWKDWKPVDHATIAFGQGIGVTAIQLASAIGALANDGELVRPRLLQAHRLPAGEWRKTPIEHVRRAVSPETANRVLGMMRGVVSSTGTGRLAGLRDVSVAGKTGTAQKLDPETGRYFQDRFIAWFIGAVPAANPEFVIVVALDEPQGLAHGGGDVAAPLFAKVAAAHLARVGIVTTPLPEPRAKVLLAATQRPKSNALPPRSQRQLNSPKMRDLESTESNRILMPDLQGLSPIEVEQFADRHALDFQSEGRGLAVEQNPAPGTILAAPHPRFFVRFRAASQGG